MGQGDFVFVLSLADGERKRRRAWVGGERGTGGDGCGVQRRYLTARHHAIFIVAGGLHMRVGRPLN